MRIDTRDLVRIWSLGVLLAAAGCASAPGKKADPISVKDVAEASCVGDCVGEDERPRVTLRNSPFGCVAGRRGAVDFLLENQVIARLGPGASKVLVMPRGLAEFVVVDGGVAEPHPLAVDGRGPFEVVAGCGLERFEGMGLRPLAVWVPEAAGCERVKVRAGGLEFELGAGEVQTLFVPAGQHVVRIGGQTQNVTVGREGAVIEVPQCTGAKVTRRAGAGGGRGSAGGSG